jgi:hypothetical protein
VNPFCSSIILLIIFHRVNLFNGFSLPVRQQKGLKRAEWEFQGWSEIVGYHVDKVLGFHRKPPIVGRKISSKELYANDASWSGLWKRTVPGYNVNFSYFNLDLLLFR